MPTLLRDFCNFYWEWGGSIHAQTHATGADEKVLHIKSSPPCPPCPERLCLLLSWPVVVIWAFVLYCVACAFIESPKITLNLHFTWLYNSINGFVHSLTCRIVSAESRAFHAGRSMVCYKLQLLISMAYVLQSSERINQKVLCVVGVACSRPDLNWAPQQVSFVGGAELLSHWKKWLGKNVAALIFKLHTPD